MTALPEDAIARLRQRYGKNPLPGAVAWNDVLTTVLGHKSVRKYLPQALPEGTLETLIAAAQSAASSSNLQPWSVVAVQDPARRATFSALAGNQKHIAACPLFLIWLGDLNRIATIARERDATVEALDYFDIFLVSIIDTALAAQNVAIAAESLGLGTVYIGGIRNHIEDVAAELKLPQQVLPLFGMCIGYPDPIEDAGIKPRLPQQAVLHRETYAATAPVEAIAAYDETLANYFRGYGQPDHPWSTTVLKRTAGIKSLNGREILSAAIRRLGFPLK